MQSGERAKPGGPGDKKPRRGLRRGWDDGGVERLLLLRGGGLDVVQLLLKAVHLVDEFLLLFFALAAVEDAQAGGVLDDVAGEGEDAGDDALVLECAQIKG